MRLLPIIHNQIRLTIPLEQSSSCTWCLFNTKNSNNDNDNGSDNPLLEAEEPKEEITESEDSSKGTDIEVGELFGN
jgi:hypothetical protein